MYKNAGERIFQIKKSEFIFPCFKEREILHTPGGTITGVVLIFFSLPESVLR